MTSQGGCLAVYGGLTQGGGGLWYFRTPPPPPASTATFGPSRASTNPVSAPREDLHPPSDSPPHQSTSGLVEEQTVFLWLLTLAQLT